MTFFLLWNPKEDILKNVSVFSMPIHWLAVTFNIWTKKVEFFKILFVCSADERNSGFETDLG